MTRRAEAVAPLIAAALWGGMYVVSKWGFSAIPPATLAFLRVAFGAGTLVVVLGVGNHTPDFSRRDHAHFAALGFWVAVTLLTQFVGTDLTNASQGSLLTVLTPVFTLVLGIALLGERVTIRKVGGMALATVGTALVLVGQYDLSRLGEANAIGIATLLLASLGWAVYTVWGTPLVRRYSPLVTATYSTVWAVPVLALAAAVELATSAHSIAAIPLTLPVIAAVVYLGVVSTALAWYLWYRGVETLEAGVVAVFFFAQPVVGSLLGVVFLGESLGVTFVAGGVVMAAGIVLASTAEGPT